MSIFTTENKLRYVESLTDVWKKGDYTFIQAYVYGHPCDNIRSLFLSCPFCGDQTFASHTLPIALEHPLTIVDSITCPSCGSKFHITEGRAERD